MNHIAGKGIFAVLVLFFIITAGAAVESPASIGSAPTVMRVSAAGSEAIAVQLAEPTPAGESSVSYTKLEMMPSYMNFVVEPGEKKEMTVTVRNRDTKSVHVQPVVRQQPYGGPYVAESSWFVVAPASADIPAGESAKFTVTTTVPGGTVRGSYSSMLTFTDEAYPTPYPQPYPNYIHTLGLSVSVASSPVILISTPYISDQLESGGEYSYIIDVKNKGKTPLALNARIGDESYPSYGPYGPQSPPLDAKSFTVSGPFNLPPGQNGTITIKVNVPRNASGYFNGNVDLGIDDPAIRMEENRIQLNFLIWKQPEAGFSKKFMVTSQEPISLELSSAMPMMMPVTETGTPRDMPRREPSFDATLTGPDGNANLVLVEKVIKGSVNLGGDPMLSNGDRPGQYQESGTQYIFTYSTQGKPGEWTLAVMPRNTQSFEYKISQGGDNPSSGFPLFTLPAGLLGNTTRT
jgi:P pilus assembly chaperone PapD